uniref:Tc3 transposase DNA binding domain-containing protein n=1 Tax=Glossina austeni TaxID=7395 RepID=A0A1A9UNZ5_GLOAU
MLCLGSKTRGSPRQTKQLEYISVQFTDDIQYVRGNTNMLRGTEVSDKECGKIERMRLAGQKVGEIAVVINRHGSTVSNFHIDQRTKRRIRHLANKGRITPKCHKTPCAATF